MCKSGAATFWDGTIQSTVLADFPSGNFDIGVPSPFTSQWNGNVKLKTASGAHNSASGAFAINAKSKYTNEIARIVDIAFAKEEVSPGTGLYGMAFNYGPENVTWKYTKADKSEYDYIIPPPGHPEVTAFTTNFQFDWVVVNNAGYFYFPKAVTASPSNGRTRQLEFRENLNDHLTTDYFPAEFLKFTAAEQDVLDAKYTDISSYVGEMRAKFITGVENIDAKWNEYVKTINDMGITDVLNTYQGAFDRFNKL
jgi:hypothetical protein